MIRCGLVRVELVRKFADFLDGIDVSNYQQGDIIDLPRRDAELLIAERWAVPHFAPPTREDTAAATAADEMTQADRVERRTVEQLRRVRADIETKRYEQQERRRAEDRIREELHDARARTIKGEPLAEPPTA